MKFTFTEKKMDASEDLRAYAEKKIARSTACSARRATPM